MKYSTNFPGRLSLFSGFAAAFLASEKANAQIIYTDISPDDTLYLEAPEYFIDLNNDGQFDFSITSTGLSCGPSLEPGWKFWTYGGGWNVFGTGGGNALWAIDEGDSICEFSLYTYWSYFFLDGGSANLFPCGGWSPGYDAYVPLGIVTPPDFYINFGWVRLELSSDASFLIVKSYAYDTIPDECIAVNDPFSITTSVNNLEPQLEIFPNPVSDELFISDLNRGFYEGQAMIYDLAGKVVLAQKNFLFHNSIDVTFLPEGLYLLQLKSTSGTIVRKFEVKR